MMARNLRFVVSVLLAWMLWLWVTTFGAPVQTSVPAESAMGRFPVPAAIGHTGDCVRENP
jgi:hypothetical protein